MNTSHILLQSLIYIRDVGAVTNINGICDNVYALIRKNEDINLSQKAQIMLRLKRMISELHPNVTDPMYPLNGCAQYLYESCSKTIWRNPKRLETLHKLILMLENPEYEPINV